MVYIMIEMRKMGVTGILVINGIKMVIGEPKNNKVRK